MKYKLKIELFSDLCAGSGKAFGMTIDSDVCYDDCGIPFIPGRRLKGCLRDEAKKLADASVISIDDVKGIFGVSGSQNSGSLQICDACLDGNVSIRNEIKKQNLDKFSVLSLYTSVRGQTSLDENGKAEENSLRYTRVVNKYNPLEHKRTNNIFLSDVGLDEKYYDAMDKICKSLRHIGMHRTRGLGAVECSLKKCNDLDSNIFKELNDKYEKIKERSETFTINYYILLDSPLTLPKPGGGIFNCIDAKSVIGCFAGKYLEADGASAHNDTFKNLFLDGHVKWSSLCISDGEKIFHPAPLNLVKLKYPRNDGKKYVNYLADDVDNMSQPKSLDNKYAARTDNGYIFTKPLCSTVYHHSKTKDATLYTQDSVDKGQIFGGTVTFGKENAENVIDLFKHVSLCFGRSRSAQYASCRIFKANISESSEKAYTLKAGNKVYAVLKSDLLILTDEKIQCLAQNDVKKAISDSVDNAIVIPEDDVYDNCAYKTISGFNTLWCLHKEPTRVVAAGSVYSFSVPCDCTLSSYIHIGNNIQEDFGNIEIIPESEMKKLTNIEAKKPEIIEHGELDTIEESHLTRAVSEFVMKEKTEKAAQEFFKGRAGNICSLSASFIGRVTLMLKESPNPESFTSRVESIKDKRKKSAFSRIYKKLIEEIDSEYSNVFNENPTEETCFIYYKAATLTVLTLAKYKLRTEKALAFGGDNHE